MNIIKPVAFIRSTGFIISATIGDINHLLYLV